MKLTIVVEPSISINRNEATLVCSLADYPELVKQLSPHFEIVTRIIDGISYKLPPNSIVVRETEIEELKGAD